MSSDSSVSDARLAQFSGFALSYLPFRNNVIAFFINASSAFPNGLLSAIVSAADYTARGQTDPPFGGPLKPTKPAPVARMTTRDASATEEATISLVALEDYKERLATYNLFHSDLKKARQCFLTAVDPTTRRVLEFNSNFATLTPAQILAVMDTEFLTITPLVLEENWSELEKPILEIGDYRESIAQREAIYGLLLTNNAGMCDFIKVRQLLAAIRHLGEFSETVFRFNETKTTVAERTYVALVAELSKTARALASPVAAVIPANPYHAAAHAVMPPVHASIARPPVNQLPVPKGTRRGSDKTGTAAVKKPMRTVNEVYCWVHGNCHHLMKDCTEFSNLTPVQLGATFADRRNGSAFNCEGK